jgi:hypothetical protein
MKIKCKKSKLFQELVKMEDLKDAGALITVQEKKGNKRYILTFSRINLSDLDHECTHLVAKAFMDRDIYLDMRDSSDQELFGYYHCYWVGRIWKVIKNWSK